MAPLIVAVRPAAAFAAAATSLPSSGAARAAAEFIKNSAAGTILLLSGAAPGIETATACAVRAYKLSSKCSLISEAFCSTEDETPQSLCSPPIRRVSLLSGNSWYSHTQKLTQNPPCVAGCSPAAPAALTAPALAGPTSTVLARAAARSAAAPTSKIQQETAVRRRMFCTTRRREEKYTSSENVEDSARQHVRVLYSSKTNILYNLAVESFLIDLCNNRESLSATESRKTPHENYSTKESCVSASAVVDAGAGREESTAAPSCSSQTAVGYTTAAVKLANVAAKENLPAAVEARILGEGPVLFLWRNDRTIVIGRHQNAWKECDVQQIERDGVVLARRYSGGGAVYQDLGNTCFTFFNPVNNFAREKNCQILLRALKDKYGIIGAFSGRNDLVVEDGRKFSGSAYSKLSRTWLHHGTLMRDVDCGALARYLTPSKQKLKSKGINSVAARVVNLRSLCPHIEHEGLCEAIVSSFLNEYGCEEGDVSVEPIEELIVPAPQHHQHQLLRLHEHPGFKKHYDVLTSWDWRYGHSPAFQTNLSTRFDWGSFDVHLNVENATISKVEIYSDCLYPDLVDALIAALKGCRFSAERLSQAVKEIKLENSRQSLLEEFAAWIATESQQ